MAKYKVPSSRECHNILKYNGYAEFKEQHGSHKFYKNIEGNVIMIPCKVNPIMWQRIVKENNLLDTKEALKKRAKDACKCNPKC